MQILSVSIAVSARCLHGRSGKSSITIQSERGGSNVKRLKFLLALCPCTHVMEPVRQSM